MKKPYFLFIGLVFSSTVCAATLQDLRPCTHNPPFGFDHKVAYQPLKLSPPLVGYCLAVAKSPREKVCMQGSYQHEKEDEGSYFKMSYWRDSKQVLEWRSDGFLMSPADTFAVELINITGDANDELVVSVMTSEGMGMGVQSSDIFVINRQKNTVSAPMTVEDYGRVSGFYGHAGQACRLLSTSWESTEDKKGWGLYAQGTWYQLKDRQWQETKALPKLSRRYLFRFEKEREQAKQPLLWFLDKTVTQF
ncbi:MAG: hypothetical protein Q7U16_05310 [Agitococcus sp.]|nr:hypothetical protein [Agitococcus sp.]